MTKVAINGLGRIGHAVFKQFVEDGAFECGYEYCVRIPATRSLGDYTPRLLPRYPIASIPLEAPTILWLR